MKRSASADRSAWNDVHVRPRDRERFVPLPRITGTSQPGVSVSEGEEEEASLLVPLIFNERPPQVPRAATSKVMPTVGSRGRITISTACDALNLVNVATMLAERMPRATCTQYPECLHVQSQEWGGLHSLQAGDVFVLDYGTVISWGLSPVQDLAFQKLLVPCQVRPLPSQEVQQEELTFLCTSVDQQPYIQNDCITISRREARDTPVKMAISHALAQSSKLSVYESRLAALVEEVRYLPESLAKHGEIRLSQKKMAQIMGRVHINKSQLNLLSSVLDVPDWFWTASDAVRGLYDKVNEYCETDIRAELVNSRTLLIQRMIGLWSDHANNHLSMTLDRVVVILVVVEVILAAAQVVGLVLHHNKINA